MVTPEDGERDAVADDPEHTQRAREYGVDPELGQDGALFGRHGNGHHLPGSARRRVVGVRRVRHTLCVGHGSVGQQWRPRGLC